MQHQVVTREEWLAARRWFLNKEKELTRLRDRLNAELRDLPWVRVEKTYVFETAEGMKTLADLFGDNSQLIVQHFMYAPEWEEGCVGCSFAIDHINAAYPHLRHHDVSYVVIGRASVEKLEAYRTRMGWGIPVASSGVSDFNYDFDVSYRPEDLASGKVTYNFEEIETSKNSIADLPGISVFYKDEHGDIFHTYSSFGRGGEEVISTYMLLDATPKGRNETGPNGNLTDWVRRNDEYWSASPTAACHGTAAE